MKKSQFFFLPTNIFKLSPFALKSSFILTLYPTIVRKSRVKGHSSLTAEELKYSCDLIMIIKSIFTANEHQSRWNNIPAWSLWKETMFYWNSSPLFINVSKHFQLLWLHVWCSLNALWLIALFSFLSTFLLCDATESSSKSEYIDVCINLVMWSCCRSMGRKRRLPPSDLTITQHTHTLYRL